MQELWVREKTPSRGLGGGGGERPGGQGRPPPSLPEGQASLTQPLQPPFQGSPTASEDGVGRPGGVGRLSGSPQPAVSLCHVNKCTGWKRPPFPVCVCTWVRSQLATVHRALPWASHFSSTSSMVWWLLMQPQEPDYPVLDLGCLPCTLMCSSVRGHSASQHLRETTVCLKLPR